MTEAAPREQQHSPLHLAAVAAAAGILLALIFAIHAVTTGDPAPLSPEEPLRIWRTATLPEKRATIELIVEQWRTDGTFSEAMRAELEDPARKQAVTEEILAKVEEANDHNSPEYVPPGETIRRTARGVVKTKKWDQ